MYLEKLITLLAADTIDFTLKLFHLVKAHSISSKKTKMNFIS